MMDLKSSILLVRTIRRPHVLLNCQWTLHNVGEALRRKMERAAADSRWVLSVTSDGAEVGCCLPSIHPSRNEANEANIPAKLPTVPNLADWNRPGSGPGICLQRQRECGMV